jgi:hypothetical protein
MQQDFELDAFDDQQEMLVPGSVMAAPRRQHAAAAMAAAGGGRQQGGLFGSAGRVGGGAAAAMGAVPRGSSGRQGPASSTSSLFAPAFMPHRNPSKQLKYKLPGAVGQGGVVKRKKGGRGGGQTKLCWG